MAEQQRSSGSSNIQQFIRTVLSVVTNLQDQTSRNNEPGSSPQQHSSVQDEISARFHIPRPEAPVPSDMGALGVFNPRQNYSIPPIRRPVRSLLGMANRRSRGSSRLSSHTATCTRTVSEPEYCYKDVCLLPSPEYDQVPRGSAKALLVENGFYVDAFKLDKTWSEARLCSELAALFENVMKLPKPACYTVSIPSEDSIDATH